MHTVLRWLSRPHRTGVTWGVPWPRGTLQPGRSFGLRALMADGPPTPVQSWITAHWPDGSVKWSAHALGPQPEPAGSYVLVAGDAAPELVHDLATDLVPDLVSAIRVDETDDEVTVDTGLVRWAIPKHGPALIRSATRAGREVARDIGLVSLWQDAPTPDGPGVVSREELRGVSAAVTVEQFGPVRAVVRLEGQHIPVCPGRAPSWLPFTVRLYFYAGADDVRVLHTLIWDGDPARDFLAGLGLRADVPMSDEPHDRHIRLAGPAGDEHRPGFLVEAVRGVTGLRRDPGARHRTAQIAGRASGPVTDWAAEVSGRAHLIPLWTDWTLDQTSADGFTLRKRTGTDCGWVDIPPAGRSAGYGYVGGVQGGLGFGLRDFAKLHPTRLDIRGAATPTATATVWLYSPSAPAMDLRFYHDGLGQDHHDEQLEGLEITYEDYEAGFADPYGVARTHELVLRAYPATPDADTLADDAAAMNDPPLLVATPRRIHAAGVFGDWSPVDQPQADEPQADQTEADQTEADRAAIEDRLEFLFEFFRSQQEQRRWYGFWDYGDVMHSYDPDRHQWRYDIGGYAWANSELSPDLWLWYQFLRTGRAEVFRFAEAMTRHTGEVDVYHLGRWRGLGTRHNVRHWGCSAKQLRISSAVYRRFYYYLTADERTGDLLREQADAERTFLAVDPLRKVRADAYTPDRRALAVGLGTDWGALAAGWLTEWERHADEPTGVAARDKLLGTMRDIAALPYGFLTGEALFNLDTGRFDPGRRQVSVSHLSAVFGLVEICSELIALTAGTAFEVPGFEAAWLRYCRLYLAPAAEQEFELGQRLRGISLIQAHSRLTAFAAARTGDQALARRAWHLFLHDEGDHLNVNPLQREPVWRTQPVTGAAVLTPVDEAPYLSTNDAAQYGLAAIQNLALLAGWADPPARPDATGRSAAPPDPAAGHAPDDPAAHLG